MATLDSSVLTAHKCLLHHLTYLIRAEILYFRLRAGTGGYIKGDKFSVC